jgi:SAM-dependent methyltransferase
VASPLFEIAGDERRRDLDGEADYVFDALRLAPGMRVADIGAGTGYYAIRLAARLGPASLVYAQENDPARLARISARADRERLLNVVPVQGYPNDPALPPGSVDVALLAHAYHQVPGPYEFLYRLAGALAPGGRVGVIGFDRRSVQYGLDPARLECEFEAVGYRRIAYYLLTPGEAYLAVFEPPDRLTDPAAIVPCGTAEPGRAFR